MTPKGKQTPTLEFRDAGKMFGRVAAVRGLRIAILPGEIYGLIGPNGSGKTTTVKMAAGLHRPTSGSVRVNGIDISEMPTKAKRGIGYVPDDPSAYDRLSGREYMAFVGELFGMERDARDRRIDTLLKEYHIEGLADGAFGSYSRGTKQKISVLAALLHDPSLLLVDEPMVGLDPESMIVTKRLLSAFAKAGGSVLLSTHSLPVAEELCQRFGVLSGGTLIAEGTAEELAAKAGRAGTLEETYLALTGAR